MKKLALILAAATLTFSASAAFAADHEGHDHGSMNMGHGDHSMMDMGSMAHQEVIDGVKATFRVMGMVERMKGMEMPKGMKETHHIAVEFKDVKTGKALTEGTVKVKVQSPDKSDQTRDLMGMQGHFGADFEMAKKGKYGVMCKFVLKDGKTRQAKFWYTVK
ncbi:MAG: hypothetical protein HXX11_21850 [Desulfuromonadales bacterium]|nr:hypothetical protein [Desulfuromonadales bacterium]